MNDNSVSNYAKDNTQKAIKITKCKQYKRKILFFIWTPKYKYIWPLAVFFCDS